MAAWYWERLTPSCCQLGNLSLLWGSGKFGTPFERMQPAKASSWEVCDPPALDEPPADGLPLLHAAASRTKPAAAMTAAAVRAADGHACRGRRVTRVLSFITPSSGLDDSVLAASVGVRTGRRCPGGGAVRRGCRDRVRRAAGRRPRPAGSPGIRFMSAPSPPAGPKIGLPATLRKPRNPVPDRRPSRDCAGRRYYSFRPATRPFAGPARRRGVLPDGGIPWLVSASPSVTAVRLGLPGRL